MLQITADIYSGRTNPSWLVSKDQEVRTALRELARNSALLAADAATSGGGLGELRGFHIQLHNDELALDHGLPDTLYLPVFEQGARGVPRELAERLIALASEQGVAAAAADGAPDADTMAPNLLRDFLTEKLSHGGGHSAPDSNAAAKPAAEDAAASTAAAAAAVTCMVEYGAYNPAFWNNNNQILRNNNCYNYASNKRTDTFAQPGRGAGSMYTAITCPEVTRAALADGLHRRYVCFPDTEKPRYLVALVVAPGPAFRDFHWYRRNKEGFWSHKPGGTAVRNVDNSGVVITNPATCNRGPYTQFCGYFYTCRSQRIR